MVADPDWSDPCDVLAWLRPQYYKVVAGSHVVQVRHGDTYTQFSDVNSTQLGNLMRQLEADCRVASGDTGRRAFTAG